MQQFFSSLKIRHYGLSMVFVLACALLTQISVNITPVGAVNTCADVSAPLPGWLTSSVNANYPFYESAMITTGVPWQLLAAIHYRETGFSHTNPSNGQGIFQFVNGDGGPYPPGAVSDSEFQRQLNFMASRIQSDYVYRGSLNYAHRPLRPNESDDFRIQDTLFSYNGRASAYANQATLYRFSSTAQPYEGSPYVMNMFDCPRASMGIITQDYGNLDSQDTRYGAFTLYARLKGESYWKTRNDWLGFSPLSAVAKSNDSPTFYLIDNNAKHKIPTGDVYYAYGLDKLPVAVVSQSYLDTIPNNIDLTQLARDVNGNIQVASRGNRYALSGEGCTNWGFDCFNPYVVANLSSNVLSQSSPKGAIPSLQYSNGSIFKMIQGKKAPFLSMDAIYQHGYNTSSDVLSIENSYTNQPLGPLIPEDTTTLRLKNGDIVLYIDGQLLHVGIDQFYAWSLDTIYNPILPPSSWDTVPPSTNGVFMTNLVGFADRKLLIDGGRKIDLTSVYNDWPQATEAAPYMGRLFNRLALKTPQDGACFRTEDGDMFIVKNGQRRSFAMYEDLYRYGCLANPQKLINIQNGSIPTIPKGPVKLGDNRLFKDTTGQDDNIYIETEDGASNIIPTYGHIQAFGFTPNDVAFVNTTTIQAYPASNKNASSLAGIAGSGTYFLFAPDNKKYYFDASTFEAWGITKETLPTYSQLLGRNFVAKPATKFARTEDGSIYYASNGSSHRINTYEAFVRLGGNTDNTMNILDDFINRLPTGSPIN